MRLHAIVLVVGVLMFSGSAAFAGTRFSVFGDGSLSTTKTTGATNPTAKLGFGGGAQVEFGLGPVAGLELGAVYLSRKNEVAGVSSTGTYIQVPLQLRYWVGKALTFGVGGYFANAIGDIKSSDGSSATYAASGIKKTDYGLIGSVGFNIPLSPGAAFMAEGRYAMGLADILEPAVPGFTTKWTDIQILAGLRFGMGK